MAMHTSNTYWNAPMRIGGSVGNNYSDPTLVNFGTVSSEKSSGNAFCGSLIVGPANNTARLIRNANDQISDASDVTRVYFDVIPAGYSADQETFLNLSGFSDNIASLSLETGNLVKTGIGGILTVGSLYIDGILMGSGSYTSDTHDFVTGTGKVVVLNGGGTGVQTWRANRGLTGAAASPHHRITASPHHRITREYCDRGRRRHHANRGGRRS